MGILNWLCPKSTRNMLVKIVHPGGHAELHDRPVLAAEIMLRNPRCLVAYPHVFRRPWAIVAPDTMLLLGQKFYLVPISTVRKLQRNSFKSPVQKTRRSKAGKDEEESHDFSATCWFHMHNNVIQSPYVCSQHSKNACKRSDTDSDNKCFVCLLSGVDSSGCRDNRSEVTASPLSSFESSDNIKTIAKTRKKNSTRGNPKKLPSIEHYWQPSLESVVEE